MIFKRIESDYQELKVLFSYHTDPNSMPPVKLSPRQVVCGPHCKDITENGRIISLQTPLGNYDIHEIINRLPLEQKPDLLVVKADATQANFPRNIKTLRIPKVMIIGDTGHLYQPLRSVIGYALQEPYDYYVADHGRRHLHFFIEAGLQNVHWMPGISVHVWDIPFQENRSIPLSFVGQVGQFHPNRVEMVNKLKDEGKPLMTGCAPQKMAFEVYGKSQITINLSLNGDINLRVFEALAAGGFLLSDKVEHQAGNDLFFRDREHLVLWKNLDDLCDKIDYYLLHPEEALDIAKQGYIEFQRSHSPERKRLQFFDMVFKGWLDPLHVGTRDKRSIVFKNFDSDSFTLRLSQVELLQTIHKHINSLNILFFPEADIKLLSDLVDLPRFHLFRAEMQHPDILFRAEVSDQIEGISPDMIENDQLTWDLIALSAKELTSPGKEFIIQRLKPGKLLITDLTLPSAYPFSEKVYDIINRLSYKPIEECGGYFIRDERLLDGLKEVEYEKVQR